MKKIFLMISVFFISFIFIGLLSSSVYASDDLTEAGELPKAGITPDSKLYQIDKFFEKVSLKLSFSNEKRIEKLSRFAEERLAELNEIDSEKASEYSDSLFNEYGLNVEKANYYLQKLVTEGKLDEDKLEKLQNRIEKSEAKQIRVKSEAKKQISQDVREQVQNAIRNSKMAIFNHFTNIDEIEPLHDEGYGYGVLLKLQAISELSSQSINDLLQIEGVVTTDENDTKHINMDALFDATGITEEQVNETLKNYRNESKEEMQNQLSEIQKNAEKRRQEIKESIKQRKQTRNNK